MESLPIIVLSTFIALVWTILFDKLTTKDKPKEPPKPPMGGAA